MKKQILFLALLTSLVVRAQQPVVNGSFQLDAQAYVTDAAIGITDSALAGQRSGFNGFGNVVINWGDFRAGMRYEAFLPPLRGFDPRLEGNGFANVWLNYRTDFAEITAGNFYEQFGSGLLFRAYEEWSLGFDNSLNGLKLQVYPTKGVVLKGVYGSQRYFWQPYTRNSRGLVRGLDADFNLNELIPERENAPWRLSLGMSGLSKYQRDADPIYVLPENVGGWAGRFTAGWGNFILAGEYATKINDPGAVNNFIYREGRAALASLSYATRGFGAVLQLKRVDNMGFKSDRTQLGNALDINFIPPLNRIHAYSLTGKYPYATQVNGEMGLQLQLNYKIPRNSLLGGKYGTSVAINFSQVNDIVRQPVNDTTPIGQDGSEGYKSKFFAVSDHVFFRDLNVEIDKRFSSRLKGVFQYMNLHYDIATLQGHAGEEAVEAHIGLADLTYRIDTRKTIRMEAQLLLTKQDLGDWAALMAEYTIAPKWFVSVSDQYNFGNPDNAMRKHFYTVAAGTNRGATRLALSAGRQAEGVVCVGGVCRQVPASSGLTLTFSTSF
ncbi:MAG: hypothetical protein IPM52_08890 [Bacteroidetes bacterium]|nr:hypothetical protein [Bacteroidota bacterium]